jgi:hypothetical protein
VSAYLSGHRWSQSKYADGYVVVDAFELEQRVGHIREQVVLTKILTLFIPSLVSASSIHSFL